MYVIIRKNSIRYISPKYFVLYDEFVQYRLWNITNRAQQLPKCQIYHIWE